MLRVKVLAFAVACMMVAPPADAQGNRGNSKGVPGSIASIQAIIDQVLAEIAALPDVTGLEQQLADLQTELAALQTSLATATGDIANLISRVAALEAAGGGAAASPVIWSGGCTTAGSGTPGSYTRYCADHVEFENAAGHLSVTPAGVFSVLTPGVYRLTYWGVSVGTTGSVRALVNGMVISSGLNTSTSSLTQRDQSVDLVYPLNTGDTVEVQVLVGVTGTNAYLPWAPPVAPGGIAAGSRLQIEYVGP